MPKVILKVTLGTSSKFESNLRHELKVLRCFKVTLGISLKIKVTLGASSKFEGDLRHKLRVFLKVTLGMSSKFEGDLRHKLKVFKGNLRRELKV